MKNLYYFKLDNQYIGNKIISFTPTDDIKNALAVTTISNAIPYIKWEYNLSPNYPRLQYIIKNIDRVSIVTHKGTICSNRENNYELYAIYCAKNKELEISRKLKYLVDNNIFDSSELITPNFHIGDYILDIMYAHSFDASKKRYTSNTHNYFFIKVVKTDIHYFNRVLLPFLNKIDGIYNIIGFHIPTGIRKKQVIRQNKREKIKYHMTHYIDPSPIPTKQLVKTIESHNNFSLYQSKNEFKVGDSAYIVRENRKKKNIYIPCTIHAIKDSQTCIVLSSSGVENVCSISQLVIKCQ
jgi:hypothetical protein